MISVPFLITPALDNEPDVRRLRAPDVREGVATLFVPAGPSRDVLRLTGVAPIVSTLLRAPRRSILATWPLSLRRSGHLELVHVV